MGCPVGQRQLAVVALEEGKAEICERLSFYGIDPETQKEYEETQARYDFLSAQAEDLRKGIADLKKVIADLEETISKRFNASFQKISVNFEHFFKILFNGGYAKILKIPVVVGTIAAPEDVDDEAGESASGQTKTIEKVGI